MECQLKNLTSESGPIKRRTISLTGELLTDSSTLRLALFAQTNCRVDTLPGAADKPTTIRKFFNTNYGNCDSHEMAQLADADASSSNCSDEKVKSIESTVSNDYISSLMTSVNVLLHRVNILEKLAVYLNAQLKECRKAPVAAGRLRCRHGIRLCQKRARHSFYLTANSKVPIIQQSSAISSVLQPKGDAGDACIFPSPEGPLADSSSCPCDAFGSRELREIKEYRMNRYFYAKSDETEAINARPIRPFFLPEPKPPKSKMEDIRPRFIRTAKLVNK